MNFIQILIFLVMIDNIQSSSRHFSTNDARIANTPNQFRRQPRFVVSCLDLEYVDRSFHAYMAITSASDASTMQILHRTINFSERRMRLHNRPSIVFSYTITRCTYIISDSLARNNALSEFASQKAPTVLIYRDSV